MHCDIFSLLNVPFCPFNLYFSEENTFYDDKQIQASYNLDASRSISEKAVYKVNYIFIFGQFKVD